MIQSTYFQKLRNSIESYCNKLFRTFNANAVQALRIEYITVFICLHSFASQKIHLRN